MPFSEFVMLARVAFALVGLVALLVGIGQLTSILSGSNASDPVPIIWALGLGFGAFAAAVWVRRSTGPTALAAWAGIAAMLATSLWPVYALAATLSPGPDVIALALIPSAIGLITSAIMARAHWLAGREGASG